MLEVENIENVARSSSRLAHYWEQDKPSQARSQGQKESLNPLKQSVRTALIKNSGHFAIALFRTDTPMNPLISYSSGKVSPLKWLM